MTVPMKPIEQPKTTIFYSVGFQAYLNQPTTFQEVGWHDLDFKKVGISTNFSKRLNDYQTWANKNKLQMVIRADECFSFDNKKEALDFEKEILGSVDIFQAEGFEEFFPNPTECVDVDVEIMIPPNAKELDENLEYESENS